MYKLEAGHDRDPSDRSSRRGHRAAAAIAASRSDAPARMANTSSARASPAKLVQSRRRDSRQGEHILRTYQRTATAPDGPFRCACCPLGNRYRRSMSCPTGLSLLQILMIAPPLLETGNPDCHNPLRRVGHHHQVPAQELYGDHYPDRQLDA